MKRLLRVLDGEPLSPPPVWLMRQAGRYLPEYRETRARAGSFLDLCYNPELAEEVTLQPIRRYGFDAAILFADILLVPHALGQHLEFVQGEGPRLAPITERAGLDALKDVDRIDETLSPVYETVGRLSRSLPDETTLIGFAGAPWTVATYMIAGRGTPDQAPAHALMRDAPAVFEAMMEIVTEATIHYLSRQVSAGAEVVKVFDSWAGSLEGDAFVRHALGPARRIAETLKARHPGLKVIGFPRGAGDLYPRFAAETGVDCVALDTNVDLAWARREMPATPLQGNLDPQLMITGGSALEDAAKRAVATMEGHPYVVNLGHGITPEADPENVHVLLKAIRG